MLCWLCQVSSINHKQAYESLYVMQPLNTQNFIAADLAQPRKAVIIKTFFSLREVLVWTQELENLATLCSHREVLPGLMWSACCELVLRPKCVGHRFKAVIIHLADPFLVSSPDHTLYRGETRSNLLGTLLRQRHLATFKTFYVKPTRDTQVEIKIFTAVSVM